MTGTGSTLTALVSAGDAAAGDLRAGLVEVAGRTVLERQVRQALRAGARRLWVLAPRLPADVARRLLALGPVETVPDAACLAQRLAGEAGEMLVLEPGVVLDERLVEAVARAEPGPSVLVFDREPPAGAERVAGDVHWASVARLPASVAREALEAHAEWEPASTLLRVALAEGARLLPVSALPRYAEGRRREVPFVWVRPRGDSGRAEAERALLDAAQKGCLDWPARFLHPPVENALVRWLWPTAVTPNMVTLATAVLGLVALLCFANGLLLPGLLLVLAVGPLDGVDGKLARTRVEYSRWGDLEHVLDKILEYGWFAALGGWFAGQGHGLAAWLAAGGIILFALLEAIHGEYFRRLTGRQLDDWGPFERGFRLVAGRRNTFFWTLLPFGLAGLWWEGFLVLLAYAGLTFAVSHARFLVHLEAYACQEAPAIRRNLAATRYAFLPGRGEQGS
ncbi:CDP-alcohol phosphatidyltransferase family protein [Thermaurantiacus tibetensis]|uniref:CDP-alcohol phosphatidyltransferase family protein n=1 Tax=Thermaurantiacus tibetensis TaxID=2759035 RepID=UPI00189056CC|nr:CDP-alcohol phosphatidyltransferase family protein [Thermaurantiacus tibetensis]